MFWEDKTLLFPLIHLKEDPLEVVFFKKEPKEVCFILFLFYTIQITQLIMIVQSNNFILFYDQEIWIHLGATFRHGIQIEEFESN